MILETSHRSAIALHGLRMTLRKYNTSRTVAAGFQPDFYSCQNRFMGSSSRTGHAPRTSSSSSYPRRIPPAEVLPRTIGRRRSHTSAPSSSATEKEPDDLIPHIEPIPLTRQELLKLHTLSALNPPPEGSEEEAELMHELSHLFGLMHLVKDIELDGDVRSLLSDGVGEVHIGEEDMEEHLQLSGKAGSARELDKEAAGKTAHADEKSGRELLNWATRRVGDFYAHRVEKQVKS